MTGIKMAVSAAGMAICLFTGCSSREEALGLRSNTAEQLWTQAEVVQEYEKEQEEQKPQTDYFSCPSGTVVEEELSPEEVSALFYAQEIPAEVFARMDGVSYVENEDVALSELRYLRLLYAGFDGKTHVGELVVHKTIADTILEIFRALYDSGYEIEKMRLIDDYGGDDHASLLDNNTSAFNYRVVEGSKKLSRHAYGLAIDINPFYNPYVTYENGVEHISPEGSEPYADREADFPHKIGKDGDLCWELFHARGFTWGGDWKSLKDYQHFQISES